MASFFKKKLKEKKEKNNNIITDNTTAIIDPLPSNYNKNDSIISPISITKKDSISSIKSTIKNGKELSDTTPVIEDKQKKNENEINTKNNENDTTESSENIPTENTEKNQNKTEDDDDKKNIWIDVMYDPFNGIQTISDCMALVDVDGINQHHLVIADFGNYKNNKYTKSGSVSSINDENTTNKTNNKTNNESDLSDTKKINEKMLKKKMNKTSSILLGKNELALNDNMTGIPILKIFKGIMKIVYCEMIK